VGNKTIAYSCRFDGCRRCFGSSYRHLRHDHRHRRLDDDRRPAPQLDADGFNAIAKANDITWSVTQVEFIMYVGGATTINKPRVVMSLYDKWVPAGIAGAGSSVFDELAG